MMSMQRMITSRPAAEVAGDRAEHEADRQADRDGDDADQKREPRAVEDARELVAAELVDAEQMVRRRPRAAAAGDQQRQVLVARPVRARSAARRSPTITKMRTSTKPDDRAGFRRSRYQASLQSPPVGASSEDLGGFELGDAHEYRIRGLMSAYEMSTIRLTKTNDEREEQDPALEHRVVAVEDRVAEPRAHPGEGEHRLGQHRAREQQPDLEADDRRHRQQRVPQDVAAVDGARRQSLRARRAHVVLVLHVEHGGAGDARDDRERDRAERDRGQDQVLEDIPERAPVPG